MGKQRVAAIAALALMVVLGGCGGSGGSDSGAKPATDAEWGTQAQPTANRLVNTYEQLDEQLNSGEGMAPLQERCKALADAAREGLELPPLPSGGDGQTHLTAGLNKIIEGAEKCSTGTADDLLDAATVIEAGFDELRSNVGALDLS